jgi:hypothetical protein
LNWADLLTAKPRILKTGIRRVVFDPDHKRREHKLAVKRRIQKRYYERHKAECLARCKAWAARNPEKKKAAYKAWGERNRSWRLIYFRDYMRRKRAEQRATRECAASAQRSAATVDDRSVPGGERPAV